jgi:hypothetical protein
MILRFFITKAARISQPVPCPFYCSILYRVLENNYFFQKGKLFGLNFPCLTSDDKKLMLAVISSILTSFWSLAACFAPKFNTITSFSLIVGSETEAALPRQE